MKKVMFLTDIWNPNPTANSICVKNIAAVFLKKGWEVYVSAFESENLDNKNNDEGIKVDYIKPSKARELMNKSLVISNPVKKSILRYLGIFLNRITRVLYLKDYPIIDPFFVKRWSDLVCKKIEEENIDIIVSVNAPSDSIAVGHRVKEKKPHVQWIAYYIDGGSNYGKEQSFFKIKKKLQQKAIDWENKVLEKSDKIIIMEGHSKYYSSYLSKENLKKMKILNVPLLNIKKMKLNMKNKKDNKKEIWTYMGTIRTGFYDPTKFFEWFRKYSKKNNAELNVYGTTNMENYLKINCRDNIIKYHGAIPHNQVEAILKESDVLVYFRSERLDSVSGKFFEYLMYQKPIVYFGPFDDINWKQLVKYPLGIAVNEDDEKTTKDISSVIYSEIEISKEFLLKEYYTSTPEAFVDIINDFSKEGAKNES